ncbi:MAG TPA: amylo-alpha-1,6-glucosidase [Chloroflexota bacterium]|nr:amylo-alpha-1,6-glucosidase [Chloroflexota bacterium]
MTPKSLEEALACEWLYTNGLGGYASSTLAGCNTRRYHGLLVAALEPPGRRTVLVSKLDETLWVGSIPFELGTNEFQDGTIHPRGQQYLARFDRPDGIPTFTFAFQGWRLEKKVWLEQGQNTTFVQYLLRGAPSACRLEVRPFCACTDFHAEQRGGDTFAVAEQDGAATISAIDGATPYQLACDHPAGFQASPDWWYAFLHRAERERGLDDAADLFVPGVFSVALVPDQPVTFRLSCEPEAAQFQGALQRAEDHGRRYVRPNPDVEAELTFAASQFLVAGRGPATSIQHLTTRIQHPTTVIAGYHWFCDWGRDTMISLPGLALGTGQPELAKDILRTFAGYVDRGMIPNLFGEQGGAEYNNVDATLWFFVAIDRYLRAAEDPAFLREVFPTLESIVDWHVKGTRFNIKVDLADGLLYAGEPGVQLTWMDAKVEDWVVTPRIGKPVEVNALWFNAMCLMAGWARDLGRDPADYQQRASQVGKSFRERFWNPAGNCLFDVIDGPDGGDASLRPNQIFAVSLPFAAIYGSQAKAVVDALERELLTPYGLRSLSPSDACYIGRHTGDRWQRDASYHQGTVWSWLIGPFVDAHLRVYGDNGRAKELLQPLLKHMREQACVGTISEVFDGDAPHTPRGCVAQAWSVAEVLRIWRQLHAEPPPKPLSLIGGNHGGH